MPVTYSPRSVKLSLGGCSGCRAAGSRGRRATGPIPDRRRGSGDLAAGVGGLDQADIQRVTDLSETGKHYSGIIARVALRLP